MSILSNVWIKIEAFFSDAEKDVIAFSDALLHSILTNGGSLLIIAAQNAVAAAESAGGTGADKFKAATDAVEAILTEKGTPIVWNAINGAIEAAVAQMRLSATTQFLK